MSNTLTCQALNSRDGSQLPGTGRLNCIAVRGPSARGGNDCSLPVRQEPGTIVNVGRGQPTYWKLADIALNEISRIFGASSREPVRKCPPALSSAAHGWRGRGAELAARFFWFHTVKILTHFCNIRYSPVTFGCRMNTEGPVSKFL